MAYTLKTSGIATNLVFCIAVDEDGTTIKEWVSSNVDTNKTVHANVTTGASTWKGTSRGYFETFGSGASPQSVEFPSPHRPTWDVRGAGSGGGNGGAIFMAVAGASALSSTGNASWVTDAGAIPVLGRTSAAGTGYVKLNETTNTTRIGDSEVAPIDGTTKWATLCNYSTFESPGWWIYHGLESASDLTLDASGNDAGTATTITFRSVGGATGFGTAPAKFHIVAAFDKTLDSTERESLFDDWFGTLFDSGGGGGGETLMGAQCL
jgi:hypothetical protein